MKLYILAVIMIIGGFGCLSNPDAVITGLICIAIGIGIIVWKVSKKRNRKTQWTNQNTHYQPTNFVPNYRDNTFYGNVDGDYQRFQEVQKRYDAVVNKHMNLLEQIGVAYTVANNLKLPNSPEMDRVIRLCEEDIGLSRIYKEYCEELRDTHCFGNSYEKLPEYPSFKRLAIIYEKRKEYDKAIAVCKQAIDLGFIDDGTDGQMLGRIARLMRKSGNARTKINQADSVESEFAE